ncbi:MAG TPA: hypothetical protein VIE17_06720 [Methylophilaceae bacterium]
MASPSSVKQLYIAAAHLVYVETQMARDQFMPFEKTDDRELGAQAQRIADFAKDLRLQDPFSFVQAKVDDAKDKISKAQIYFYEINNANQTTLTKDDVFNAVIDVISALADVLSDVYLGQASHHMPTLSSLN